MILTFTCNFAVNGTSCSTCLFLRLTLAILRSSSSIVSIASSSEPVEKGSLITIYRGKAKYLIRVIIDRGIAVFKLFLIVIAVFKFWFHDVFVVTKSITSELCTFMKLLINLFIIFVTKNLSNCKTGVIFDPGTGYFPKNS